MGKHQVSQTYSDSQGPLCLRILIRNLVGSRVLAVFLTSAGGMTIASATGAYGAICAGEIGIGALIPWAN